MTSNSEIRKIAVAAVKATGKGVARMSAADLINEREFQTTVIEKARVYGWTVYHTHDSRRSALGFPDLTLVRDGRLIFMELKTQDGRLTEAQEMWLSKLEEVMAACIEHVEARVFRPSDWPRIEVLLR